MLASSLFTTLAALATTNMVASAPAPTIADGDADKGMASIPLNTVLCVNPDGGNVGADLNSNFTTYNKEEILKGVKLACHGKVTAEATWGGKKTSHLFPPPNMKYADKFESLTSWDMTYTPSTHEADHSQQWVFKMARKGTGMPVNYNDKEREECFEGFKLLLDGCAKDGKSGGAWSPEKAYYLFTPYQRDD